MNTTNTKETQQKNKTKVTALRSGEGEGIEEAMASQSTSQYSGRTRSASRAGDRLHGGERYAPYETTDKGSKPFVTKVEHVAAKMSLDRVLRVTLGPRIPLSGTGKEEPTPPTAPSEVGPSPTPTTGGERNGGEIGGVTPSQPQPSPLDQPRWAHEGMEVDSLDGSATEEEVDVVDITEEEALKKKKGRGRYPKPGCGLYVGKREKDEERARQKKEDARVDSARKALDPLVPPKGARWNKVLRQEEDMEEELSHAPLEDIVARMVEQSATIYKIADCSNGMKGSLVGEMKKVVAMVRAATTVLAERARENEEMGSRKELERYRKEVKQLREEIRETPSGGGPKTSGSGSRVPSPKSEEEQRSEEKEGQ